MLSKIKKSILILLMAFCLTGCCNIENSNPQQPVIENKEEEINKKDEDLKKKEEIIKIFNNFF